MIIYAKCSLPDWTQHVLWNIFNQYNSCFQVSRRICAAVYLHFSSLNKDMCSSTFQQSQQGYVQFYLPTVLTRICAVLPSNSLNKDMCSSTFQQSPQRYVQFYIPIVLTRICAVLPSNSLNKDMCSSTFQQSPQGYVQFYLPVRWQLECWSVYLACVIQPCIHASHEQNRRCHA